MNSQEVCVFAKITYRKLDHWCSKGWVPDMDAIMGIGTRRNFTQAQAQHLRRMSALVAAGVYPEKAQQIAKEDKRAIDRLVAALQPCMGMNELIYRQHQVDAKG